MLSGKRRRAWHDRVSLMLILCRLERVTYFRAAEALDGTVDKDGRERWERLVPDLSQVHLVFVFQTWREGKGRKEAGSLHG